MIVGIGVDVVEVKRMQEAIGRNPRFVGRVFGAKERAYCEQSVRPYEKYAVRYAAKEAFLKVCGQGIFACTLSDIQVVHDDDGKPTYELSHKALRLLKEKKITQMHLSLSHDGGLATAFALGEGL